MRTLPTTQRRASERSARGGLFSAMAAGLLLTLVADAGASPLAAQKRAAPNAVKVEGSTWLDLLAEPVTSTSWIASRLQHDQPLLLSASPDLSLLARFFDPSIDRPPAWQSFFGGRYGSGSWLAPSALTWRFGDQLDELDSERMPEPLSELVLSLHPSPQPPQGPRDAPLLPTWALDDSALPAPQWMEMAPDNPCPAWQNTHPVTVVRFDGEQDRFRLLDCDGKVAPYAIDRLSVLARLPDSPRPELPLPLVPAPPAGEPDEWIPSLRMVHPRLVWLVQRFASEFPHRPIVIVSGYRHDRRASYHRRGRALDFFIVGIEKERAFRFCRELPDVGCGYYPNHKFIHADVREYGRGHPMWVDVSEPGEPSQYVDSWPGLVEAGALPWGEQ